MSPILVRPVREQLEHDRLIRHLQQKYKRKFEVALNLGDEQVSPVKIGALTLFPDLVLTADRKLGGVVEVESGESVNKLEAMAQWVHFARSRVPFHLYVPVPFYEAARRLCEAHKVHVSEVWTYRPAPDGFDLVRMSSDPKAVSVRHKAFAPRPVGPGAPAPAGAVPAPNGAKAKAPVVAKAARSVRPVGSAKAVKPVKSAKPAKSAKVARVAPKVAPKPVARKKPADRRKAKPAATRRR